jgi:DNA-binding IclR family transcriptional regulator
MSASACATESSGHESSRHRTSRSLISGLELLRQFTPEQPERGISELALAMGVSRPTAHRYAATCLELGYLEQVRTRRYRLTRRAAEPGMTTLDDRRYSRALHSGLAILACFTPERALLGSTEIAQLLGMSVATTRRFVVTLAEVGYLERDPSSKYRLSLQAIDLGIAGWPGVEE